MDLENHIFVKNTRTALEGILGIGKVSGTEIIVGLSGGADSVSLLISLYAISEEMGFTLCACHVNHMIRGKEADRDEEFSRKLCERYSIPFKVFRKDVPAIAREQKKSLEEAARDVRYEIFESLLSQNTLVATAHTASDNAETVLYNLTRGCGTGGLSGIPARRDYIIRPILGESRTSVESFLSDIGESYVTDSTNLQDDCTRNIIRHKIIPVLRKINPCFFDAIANLSELSSKDNAFLCNIALEQYTDDVIRLSRLDSVISSRIIGEMYRRKSGKSLPFRHTELLISEIKKSVAEANGESRLFDLPMGFTARIECGRLSILDKKELSRQNTECTEYDIPLKLGTTVILNGAYIAQVCRIEENSDFSRLPHDSITKYEGNIYTLFMEAHLFTDIIDSIHLRSGKSGDKIRISGMSKDIRKMYSSKKIPVNERKMLPRIYSPESNEILALPFVGVSDSQMQNIDKANLCIRLYKSASRSDFTDNEQQK